ncbi:hypothetical protein D9M68_1000850 [compost metagenome]
MSSVYSVTGRPFRSWVQLRTSACKRSGEAALLDKEMATEATRCRALSSTTTG